MGVTSADTNLAYTKTEKFSVHKIRKIQRTQNQKNSAYTKSENQRTQNSTLKRRFGEALYLKMY